MRIRTKALTKLTTNEYRACHNLNMRGEGTMMYSLMDQKENPNAHAVMAWEGDKLLGWALCVPCKDEHQNTATSWQRRKSKYVTQFYVRVPYRGKGIGTRLMAAVKRLDETPAVIPHDRTSADFFASHKVVVASDRRYLVTAAKRRKKK